MSTLMCLASPKQKYSLPIVLTTCGLNQRKILTCQQELSTLYVMNIEWDYNYYQLQSDNEWLVDEMLAMLDEDIIMQ